MFSSSSKSDLYIKNRNTLIHTKKQAIVVLAIYSCSAKHDCIKMLCIELPEVYLGCLNFDEIRFAESNANTTSVSLQ